MQVARLILVAAALCVATIHVRANDTESPLTDQQRREVILGLADLLEETYVEADIGLKLATQLRTNLESGTYADYASPDDLASALTLELRPHDRHFAVAWYPPESGQGVGGMHYPLTEENIQAWLEYARSQNFGFRRLEFLPGNVGYLDLLYFDGTRDYPDAANCATAAMNFLAFSDAVIIDLRHNGGGEPDMVQFLMSYFLGPERIHYNDLYWRKGEETVQYWTLPHVQGPRILEAPLFILTSARTGSAAEAFAYHLQALERATIIGDVSAGGGHPGEGYWIAHGFSAFISNGKAISPITGGNWDMVGVKPDIEVPSGDSLDRAYAEALRVIIEGRGEEEASDDLRWALEALDFKRQPVEISRAQLEELAGTYGDRTIRIEEDHLTYQRGKRMVFEMVPLGDDRFLTIGKDAFRLQFKRDSQGKITGLLDMWAGGHNEWNAR